MEIIEPTHEEIMNYLDCFHFSKWHKGQCVCTSRDMFQTCYKLAKMRLTKHIFTDEEIREYQEQNRKAMNDIDKALDALY